MISNLPQDEARLVDMVVHGQLAMHCPKSNVNTNLRYIDCAIYLVTCSIVAGLVVVNDLTT